MDVLFRLLALQPVFTLFGLRTVWYIYLLNLAVQLYIGIIKIFELLQQQGISWQDWSPNIIPLALGTVSQLLIVRLLIEIAATILLSRGNSSS